MNLNNLLLITTHKQFINEKLDVTVLKETYSVNGVDISCDKRSSSLVVSNKLQPTTVQRVVGLFILSVLAVVVVVVVMVVVIVVVVDDYFWRHCTVPLFEKNNFIIRIR